MTYYEWLNSKGCGCNNGCRDINPCSCDEILLEISNLHTDDQVLQTEIDDLSGKVETISGVVDTKLDVSAYTPTDLSNYYTKEEVNSAITEVESEIPSLSGYATEQWVESQGYLTDVDLSDYALTANTYTKTEVNNLVSNKIWCGTQEEYDSLSTKQNDVLYLIHQ